MPAPAFTLSIPADEPYRALAAESVRTYLRASGAAVDDGVEAFVTAVAEAVERLASPGADVELAVVAQPSQIEVQLTCGAASETLVHGVEAAGG